ncbi:hypothetical protein B566_EDAN010592 [Ephemera danica]|nr:hypothetical protein B566_EDAN010592 [Ephemera danica]
MADIQQLLTALLLVITITSTLAGTGGTSEGRDRRAAPAKKPNENGNAKPNVKANKAVQKNSGKAKKVEGKQAHVMPVYSRPNFVPCVAINSKLLDRCCRTPSSEFFTEGQLLTSNRQRRNVDLFNSITEYRMNVLHGLRSDNLVDLRNPNIVKKFAEEACLLDAVFKEYQYVDGSGNIDYSVTKNFLLSTSSKLWRPITANIIDECQKVITVLQQKNVLTQRAMYNRKTNESCSIVPYVFIECVRRNLSLVSLKKLLL